MNRFLCPGTELNRYGHCCPQDFLTSYSFHCSRLKRDLWSGLYLHLVHQLADLGALRLVSTPFPK